LKKVPKEPNPLRAALPLCRAERKKNALPSTKKLSKLLVSKEWAPTTHKTFPPRGCAEEGIFSKKRRTQ